MYRMILPLYLLLNITAAGAQTSLANTTVLDSYLDDAVAATHIPGLVALAVDRDGVFYMHASGTRNATEAKAMTPDTIFRIASMTKPITSVAIMMLAEENKLDIDDPISKYLTALQSPRVFDEFTATGYESHPANNAMTIRHLLTHTSGLAYSFSNSVLARMLENSNDRAISHALVHEPGQRWTYGESTRVLGTLVEEVSGLPLETFMRNRIFLPLGMDETSYTVPRELNHRVATVHRMTDDGLVETPNPDEVSSPMNGDGGLHSTASDYAKFIQLFLNEGVASDGARLLSARSIAEMGKNHIGAVRVSTQHSTDLALSRDFPAGAGRDTFGLGFQITGEHDSIGRSPGSMAWAGIFNTEFWIDPAKGVGGVLMMQYLPFYDSAAIDTLLGFEDRLYRQLR